MERERWVGGWVGGYWMHVRVLGADGAGGAAEELGQEAAVAAHAADGARRLRRAAARSFTAGAWGRLAAPHG